MSSDKSDKTVFRQPDMNPDRTVIRPSPGRRPQADAAPESGGSTQPAAGATTNQAPDPGMVPQYQPDLSMQADVYAPGAFKSGNRLNSLVNEASTLIAVFSKTRKLSSGLNWVISLCTSLRID